MSDMSTFKKIGLFGIGIFAIAQDKIEEFVQEAVKKGELTKEEGKAVVSEILLKKSEQIEEVKHKVGQKTKDVIETSGIATKEDIDILKKRLETIEEELKNMTGVKEDK